MAETPKNQDTKAPIGSVEDALNKAAAPVERIKEHKERTKAELKKTQKITSLGQLREWAHSQNREPLPEEIEEVTKLEQDILSEGSKRSRKSAQASA